VSGLDPHHTVETGAGVDLPHPKSDSISLSSPIPQPVQKTASVAASSLLTPLQIIRRVFSSAAPPAAKIAKDDAQTKQTVAPSPEPEEERSGEEMFSQMTDAQSIEKLKSFVNRDDPRTLYSKIRLAGRG
jgi:protein-serine/threonine kinase